MSDMSAIIDVFRMEEISKKKRASIIIELGSAINMSLGGNYTESLVWELVEVLDPENKIFSNPHYFYCSNGWNGMALVNCFFFFSWNNFFQGSNYPTKINFRKLYDVKNINPTL